MKLNQLLVSSIIVGFVAAFKNAAPLLIQQDNTVELDQLTYVTKQESLPICSLLSTQKNLILQIPNLSNQDLVNGHKSLPQVSKLISADYFKFTPFYKYANVRADAVSCEGMTTKNIVIEDLDDEAWLNQFQDLDEQEDEIIVFRFPQLSGSPDARLDELNKIDSFISSIVTLIEDNKNFKILVQGLPVSKSLFGQIPQQLDNLLHKQKKRSDDVDYDKLKEEFDETFKEIEDMLAAEGDDTVSINASSGNSTSGSGTGLLSKYQFFSPGIWMATIVSFFLVSVLITAFQWLNSLQISYKSFEKQVNNQKKTQ